MAKFQLAPYHEKRTRGKNLGSFRKRSAKRNIKNQDRHADTQIQRT